MQPDLDKLNFYTGVNYMKRSDKSGQSTISTTAKDIDHSLGYVPQFLVFADLFGDGFIWYGGECVFEGTESTSFFPSPPELVDSWMTASKLTMTPYNISGSRPLYWLIYLDYGV